MPPILGSSDAAMSDLPSLLLASLAPATRKQAEHSLGTISSQPGFLLLLLQLVLDPSQDRSVRLAGSVFFKNMARKIWDEVRIQSRSIIDTLLLTLSDRPIIQEQEGLTIHNNEKSQLRAQLVPALIFLSGPTDKAIRAQIAETVSIIAEYDFPEKWDDLIDVCYSFSFYRTHLSIIRSQATRDLVVASTFRIRHERRDPRNCPFYLPSLAFRCTLRRPIHRHQLRSLSIHRTLSPTFPPYRLQSSFGHTPRRITRRRSGTGRIIDSVLRFDVSRLASRDRRRE